MVTYYHRFLPGIAGILAPLHELLKGRPRKLTWNPIAEAAFQNAKRALTKATNLTFPDGKAPLQLVTDASGVAVGAALQQMTTNGPRPIAFFSKKLSPTEKRYSTFDRELLAAYLAVNHFKHLLEATPFQLLTDHLKLVHAITKKSDPQSAWQQ